LGVYLLERVAAFSIAYFQVFAIFIQLTLRCKLSLPLHLPRNFLMLLLEEEKSVALEHDGQ
jgi:hypothetical protein